LIGLKKTKNVGATAIRFLLKQTRAARLAFLAGLVDSDGHISQLDRTYIVLGQSLVNTATTRVVARALRSRRVVSFSSSPVFLES
jgi:hypothetical protein